MPKKKQDAPKESKPFDSLLKAKVVRLSDEQEVSALLAECFPVS